MLEITSYTFINCLLTEYSDTEQKKWKFFEAGSELTKTMEHIAIYKSTPLDLLWYHHIIL
uniref:Uncharacterized protein n=1 Tax=Lepeophtheirus salmonis TaxID=72036 RepID=A0A0K2T6G1_LEPSM